MSVRQKRQRVIHWEDIIGDQHLGPADIRVDWKTEFGLLGTDERSIGFGPLLKIGIEGVLVQPIRLPRTHGFVDLGYVVIDVRGNENNVVGLLSLDECQANVWDENNSFHGSVKDSGSEPKRAY